MDWITSADLVAAVSNAGGLGVIGPNAGDTETLTVSGLPGVLRALKTLLMERCVQAEASGDFPVKITELYHSGYLKGMLEGETIEGTFVCGAGAGLIKEIKRAADIVHEIINEAERILAGI